MVFLNYSTMQMVAKIVYYGPGLCGKTTNLREIYRKTSIKSRGEMVSLETETDRTLFFDLLPMDVGVIGGFKTKFQLYTVPGQVFYNSTRKLVLRGVDGIVFVADSQVPMLDANRDSYENLRENLEELGLNIQEIPLVFQFNKRDLPNIISVERLNQTLNELDRPYIEASALKGIGVFETLKEVSKMTLLKLRSRALDDGMKKKDPISLKARGSAESERIREDLQHQTELGGTGEDEPTLVRERAAAMAASEAGLSMPQEADPIPENVSFDNYPGSADTSPHVEHESEDHRDFPIPGESGNSDHDIDEKIETTLHTIDFEEADDLDENDFEIENLDSLDEDADHENVVFYEPGEHGLTHVEDGAPDPGVSAFEVEDSLDSAPRQPKSVEPLDEYDPPPATEELISNLAESDLPDFFEEDDTFELEDSLSNEALFDAEPDEPGGEEAHAKVDVLLPGSTMGGSAKAADALLGEIESEYKTSTKTREIGNPLQELETFTSQLLAKSPKSAVRDDSVESLMQDLVDDAGPVKQKFDRHQILMKGHFDRAQLNCVLLDEAENVVHTQLLKVSPVALGGGKFRIKVILDIEAE